MVSIYVPRKSAKKWARNAEFEGGKSPFLYILKTYQIDKKSLLEQKLQNEQDLVKT